MGSRWCLLHSLEGMDALWEVGGLLWSDNPSIVLEYVFFPTQRFQVLIFTSLPILSYLFPIIVSFSFVFPPPPPLDFALFSERKKTLLFNNNVFLRSFWRKISGIS